MKTLLIGATGATGSDLLQLLLNDGEIESVEIFVRRDPQIRHAKLTVNRIDFERPEQWAHRVKGDILFSCLGTTLKDAGSKVAQWKVDFDYQYRFAKVAKENGMKCFVALPCILQEHPYIQYDCQTHPCPKIKISVVILVILPTEVIKAALFSLPA